MTTGEDSSRVIVRLPATLYSIDAVKRAAYCLTDRVTVEIEPGDTGITCTLSPLSSKTDMSLVEAHFRNAVLDHDLRIAIAKETEPLRNLVLSIAFSKTGLQG